MRLRDDYVKDATGGVNRWNNILKKEGIEFAITLPHVAFHRHQGEFSAIHADPDGNLMSDDEWQKRKDEWIPSKADGDYIDSLMKPQWESGKYAGWISPPRVGIDNKPGDFEYVKVSGVASNA